MRGNRKIRAVTLAALVLGVASCQWNLPRFNPEGYRLYELSEGHFAFDVDSTRLSELGGPRGAKITQLIDRELSVQRLCPKGWRILNDGGGKGYYYINGECQ